MKNEQNQLLLVDDEKDLCWTFEMQFEDSEYELTTVQSGEEAVKEMKKSFYPTVILDSKLPGIDGFETARRLKKTAPETEIILFSGYHNVDDEEIQEGIKQGLFSSFVSKPFDFNDINKLIKVNTKITK